MFHCNIYAELLEACRKHEKDEKLIQILIGKLERRRVCEKTRRRWEGNCRNGLGKIGLRIWLDTSG
jgi:hypothetical protein